MEMGNALSVKIDRVGDWRRFQRSVYDFDPSTRLHELGFAYPETMERKNEKQRKSFPSARRNLSKSISKKFVKSGCK